MKQNDTLHRPTTYINSLIGFYILVPLAYLGYVMFTVTQTKSNYNTFLNSDPLNAILLLSAMICLIWAYILWKLRELNQQTLLTKFLLYMAVSQLFLGNVLGVIFTIITRIKTKSLNTGLSIKKEPFQCKVLTILNMVLTIIVAAAFIRIYS